MNKIKQIENTPMSNEDIDKYFPDAQIIKYNELEDVKDIKSLFKEKPYFFLLYLDSQNSGHWVVVTYKEKYNEKLNNIYFFDSYGYKPDDQLKFVPNETRIGLGVRKTFLTDLFNKSNCNIFDKDIDYQNKKTNSQTCGRHCCNFLMMFLRNDINLIQYYKLMEAYKKELKLNYDEIVSVIISK